MDIEVSVNGTLHRLAQRVTLAELMTTLNTPPRGVAVAVNREVVPRRGWDGRTLQAGDRIEVVRAIGGG